MGFRTPHRCLHAIAPMPLIYKALERFREVKQRLYFVLERSGSGSASGLQARPTAPRTAARSCRPALLPRASRRAYPVLHSSALVLSLPSAGAQGLSARRTFRTRTSAPCALQCKHSRLASALNWRLACPHLAPAWPWHLCGWGEGGLAGCGPCSRAMRGASPGWRLQFAARLPAARWACMGRVTALTDDDACVPAYR